MGCSKTGVALTDRQDEIYKELSKLPIFEYHGHYKWREPVVSDVLGLLTYHYFTENAHANGMDAEIAVRANDKSTIDPEERLKLAIEIWSYASKNIMAAKWLKYIAANVFHYDGDWTSPDFIDGLNSAIIEYRKQNGLSELVRGHNIDSIGLTNPPGDDLVGVEKVLNADGKPLFRTAARADDVFYLLNEQVRDNLQTASIQDPFTQDVTFQDTHTWQGYLDAVRLSIEKILFSGYKRKQIGYSIVLSNQPMPSVALTEVPRTIQIPEKTIPYNDARHAFERLTKDLRKGKTEPTHKEDIAVVQSYLMDYICDLCTEYDVTFQYMPGVRREAYKEGVKGGRDIADMSIGFADAVRLINRHGGLRISGSVLHQRGEEELTSIAWHNPNVTVSGPWWWMNTIPGMVEAYKRRLMISPERILGGTADSYTSEYIPAKHDTDIACLAIALDHAIEWGAIKDADGAIKIGTKMKTGNVIETFPGWDKPLEKNILVSQPFGRDCTSLGWGDMPLERRLDA